MWAPRDRQGGRSRTAARRAGAGAGRRGRRAEREARPPASQRAANAACPLAEAAGAVDGEGAPPGGPGAQAAAMRVNEKYSTLPAADRSVHIINICAIEDIGYLPSEGTVSAGGRDPAGGPRTCTAPRTGATGGGRGAPGPRDSGRVGGGHPRARARRCPASQPAAASPERAAGAPGGIAASPREGGSLQAPPRRHPPGTELYGARSPRSGAGSGTGVPHTPGSRRAPVARD